MKITAIICTYNEEKHIRRCINALTEICSQIIVVDSFSDDDTVRIAQSMGAEVHFKEYITYSEKLNYAIENLDILGDWVLKIDADEYLNETALKSIKKMSAIPEGITGFRIKRKIKFLGKIMHDSSSYHLKIWKKGYALCEERWMDERMILKSGVQQKIPGLVIDENLISLKEWSIKHSNYAVKEALDHFLIKYNSLTKNQLKPSIFGKNEESIRYFKMAYLKVPLFIRPIFVFIHKYIIMGGFKSGVEGLIWCTLQSFWYRFLVDSIIYDCAKNSKNKEATLKYFQCRYGLKIFADESK